MSNLVLGLYAEGRSDYSFLPSVVGRTAEQILVQHEQNHVEPVVVIIELTKDQKKGHIESIFQAAIQAFGCHALIIHADADHPTSEKALRERFHPGNELVQQTGKEVCKNLLPLIPVYMTEAWMIADHKKLRELLRTNLSAQVLGLPEKAKSVESYRDPKQMLNEVVRKVHPNKPRLWSKIMGEIYIELAPRIRLERLQEVPAYQQFVKDLTEILKKLNIIH